MKEYYKTYKHTDAFKSYKERTKEVRKEKARIHGKEYYKTHREQVKAKSKEGYENNVVPACGSCNLIVR